MAEMAVEQPWLGGEDLWPDRPDIVETVKSRSFMFTGKIIGKDESLCRAVCIDLMLGELSLRQIAARYGISRNSISAIESVMRERGELEPLAKVIKAEMSKAIVLGLWRWNEGLRDGIVHPGQVPIPTAALIDKRAQLEVGIVPGTDRTVGAVTLEQVLAEHALAKAALDRRSQDTTTQPAAPQRSVDSEAAVDTGLDTPPTAMGPVEPRPGSAAALEPAVVREGAGGVAAAAAPPDTRWTRPENSDS